MVSTKVGVPDHTILKKPEVWAIGGASYWE